MSSRNVGGRPRKVNVELTPEALESMLKNIWNEVEETKIKATQQYNKQIKSTVDNNDVAMIGKINVDFLKTINDTSEKKISCARLIKDYLQKDQKATDDGSGKASVVTEDEKKQIFAIFNSANNKEAEEEETVLSIDEMQENEDLEIKNIIEGTDESSQEESDITDAGF